MNTTPDDFLKISAKEIKHWADIEKVEAVLPDIIRNLILASSQHLRRCEFLHGECNNLPGLDGHVINHQEHPFVPLGESYWEIGCEKSASSKANRDYDKRTQQTPPELRAKLTFVFVSPQIWAGREKWETEKRRRGDWFDVRTVTAPQLADWLNEYPSQQLSFAQRLGKWHNGAETLESAWNHWATATHPHFPESFFKIDIARYKPAFIKWIQTKEKAKLTIAAGSYAEAYAFIHIMMNEKELHSYKNRTIIFHSEEAIQLIMRKEPRIIPIASNENVLTACIFPDSNGHCIQVCTPNHPILEPDITIGRLPLNELAELSAKQQLSNINLLSLAEKCGYNRSLFHRKLQFPPLHPKWVNDIETHAVLLPLAMLGYWEKLDEFQNSLFVKLLGEQLSTNDVLDILSKMSTQEHCPIWLRKPSNIGGRGPIWIVHSKEDILEITFKTIRSSTIIIQWFEILKIVLKQGKHVQFDNIVRQVLNTTLFLNLNIHKLPQEYANFITDNTVSILSKALQQTLEDTQSMLWKHLSLIAEIIPNIFLHTLNENLERGAHDVRFAQDQFDEIMSSLTMLAIPATYFKEVIKALCLLANKTGNSRMKEDITNVLSTIFNVTYPGSNAAIAHRIRTFRNLRKTYPEHAWNIALQIATPYNNGSRYCNRPTQRSGDWEPPHSYVKRDAYEMYSEAVDTLLGSTCWTAEQAIKICQLLPTFFPETQKQACEKLKLFSDYYSHKQKFKLYTQIEESIRLHENEEGFAIEETNLLLKHYSRSIPDFLIIHIFSFAMWRKCIQGNNIKERLSKLRRVQQQLLSRKLKRDSQIILSLIEQASTDINALASAAYQVLSRELLSSLLIDCFSHTKQEAAKKLLSSILIHGINDRAHAWLLYQLQTLPEQLRLPLLLLAPVMPVTWETINESYPEYAPAYWQECTPQPCLHYSSEWEPLFSSLLNANRAETALECCISNVEHIPTRILSRILGLIALRRDNTTHTLRIHNLIQTALICLQQRDDITLHRLARLEIYFGGIFWAFNIKLMGLSKLLLSTPQLAVAIARKFDLDKAPRPPHPFMSQILMALEQVSLFSHGSVDRKELIQWCNDVMQSDEASETALLRILGCILGSGSAYDMSEWLCPALIDAIERYYCPDFQRHFIIAVSNQSHRVQSRAIDEGGMREAHCVEALQRLASSHREQHHHCTARLIESIADDMASLSLFHDEIK